MNFIFSIVVAAIGVTLVVLIPWVGVGAFDLRWLFGVIVPYAALGIFIIGMIYRVIGWARSPVPNQSIGIPPMMATAGR